ncbi:hypothetical protein EMO92_06750 [Bifidobacterium reuteri]|uniref:HtrL family protein n=1 Tax=Bifidobacterium reuteri TaxID=983706 RepID=A0A5J5E7J0_9BIFI|nr:WlaTC/HtrL family glycosyltransferase [Bifidobacterium reuteri]KAA8825259.1 hypothetical protein EMO92_06750 [Bifidobacterium reuteri]
MRDGITLVTAFFPIGREQWSGYSRSNEKYFDWFSKWAIIHNDLIVYTTEAYADKVKSIREQFGRSNTIVHVVADLKQIDPEVFSLMTRVGAIYPDFSLYPHKPEVTNVQYDFIMYAKFWCLEQAAQEAQTTKLAWIDFSFYHGAEGKPSNFFDFEWNFKQPQGHASIFQRRVLPTEPVFDWVRRTDSYVHGACFELDTDFAAQIHKDARMQYMHLLRCGILDDDQTILVMCHLAKPQDYHLLPISSWFTMMEEYAEGVTAPGKDVLDPEIFDVSISMRCKWILKCLVYIFKEFKHLITRYAY